MHGYRRLACLAHAEAFAFGFGLSYSTFRHTDVVIEHPPGKGIPDGLRLSLKVLNTGAMAAEDCLIFPGRGGIGVELELQDQLVGR